MSIYIAPLLNFCLRIIPHAYYPHNTIKYPSTINDYPMDNDASDPAKIIKELVGLAQRHPVKGVDLSRTKRLMRTLKQSRLYKQGNPSAYRQFLE